MSFKIKPVHSSAQSCSARAVLPRPWLKTYSRHALMCAALLKGLLPAETALICLFRFCEPAHFPQLLARVQRIGYNRQLMRWKIWSHWPLWAVSLVKPVLPTPFVNSEAAKKCYLNREISRGRWLRMPSKLPVRHEEPHPLMSCISSALQIATRLRTLLSKRLETSFSDWKNPA